jgi:hypothetical protein
MFINGIELKDAVFLNEFKPSRATVESKYTEDGREFLFIKKTATAKEPFQFSSDKVTKTQLEQIKLWRDNVEIVAVMLADNRQFNALVMSVDDRPDIEYEQYDDTDEFSVNFALKELK